MGDFKTLELSVQTHIIVNNKNDYIGVQKYATVFLSSGVPF